MGSPRRIYIRTDSDYISDRCLTLGSCNNVYLKNGKLVGSNTDWIGILECLRSASKDGIGKPALLIGAGGAARAAVYALYAHLGCPKIYIVNRDEQEVADLRTDSESYGTQGPELIHIRSPGEAKELAAKPFYVVGTVPDFEPKTEEERAGFEIIRYQLSNAGDTKGVFLDMCFNPRRTRFLKLAEELGWKTVEGINIIGWQLHEQYTLWAGKDVGDNIPAEKAWAALRKAADANPLIN